MQRHYANLNTLKPHRRTKLEEVNFPFSIYSKNKNKSKFTKYQQGKWDAMYAQLSELHKKFGHCCLPVNYSKNPTLGHWISAQRRQYTNGTLDEERKLRLKKIDFIWVVQKKNQGASKHTAICLSLYECIKRHGKTRLVEICSSVKLVLRATPQLPTIAPSNTYQTKYQ
jgi:Helicase associated domain